MRTKCNPLFKEISRLSFCIFLFQHRVIYDMQGVHNPYEWYKILIVLGATIVLTILCAKILAIIVDYIFSTKQFKKIEAVFIKENGKTMKKARLVVLDVDGTLTDGGIYYGENGMELKKFCTKDAAGIFACQAIGIECMILTGRKSTAVERRASDLHIQYVVQGVKDKAAYLSAFMAEHDLQKDDVIYIGDDLNDLAAMKLCGIIGCPADAAEEVQAKADFIAEHTGGHGAVRDILFAYLKQCGLYEQAISAVYGLNYSGI